MRVVAFYTVDTPYEAEAEVWKESFKTCNTALFPVQSTGAWETNCALKPQCILAALDKFPNEHILYVDIDSRLMRPLVPVPNPHVPGLCWWNARYQNFKRELCSGTIYIPNNRAGRDLVNLWIEYQKANPKVWDQKVLQHVVETKEIPHDTLGYEWISIDGHIKPENPIIHHTQASRRHKKRIT